MTPALLATAADWHVKMLGATDPAIWDAFSDWLEAAPAHAAAYEQIAALDADLAAPLDAMPEPVERPTDPIALPEAANDDDGVWRRRGRFGAWMAAAASVAAAVTLYVHNPAERSLLIETPLGQQGTTTLADGSVIHVNGGSKLVVKGRAVQLLAGEAAFSVHHDAAHPFAVLIGDHEIRDVGTQFNIRRDDDGFAVEVAEGRVAFDPSAGATELGAGEGLMLVAGEVRRYTIPADRVGGWQQRRLSYDATPLPQIAQDLTRLLGVPITVAPKAARQRYTGSIVVPQDRAEAIQMIALTLDLKAVPQKGGYLLTR